MAYSKQNWQTGQVVTADKLNHMESGIKTADTAAAAAYKKPSGGIPKTDLASAVQTSLGKADSAAQPSDLQSLLPAASVTHETWTFTLEDDTEVTKEVVLWAGA